MGRQPEPFLVNGKLCPGTHTFAYIEHRSYHTNGGAILVANYMPTIENAGISAICAEKAIFVGPALRQPVYRGVNTCVDAVAVIRVDVGDPPLSCGFHLVSRMPVGSAKCLVPDDVVCGKVPVPDRIVSREVGEPQAFLNKSQRTLSFEALPGFYSELLGARALRS